MQITWWTVLYTQPSNRYGYGSNVYINVNMNQKTCDFTGYSILMGIKVEYITTLDPCGT